MKPDAAETIALLALGWLASERDLLELFMGSTGASAPDFHQRARDPVFQGAVLDFLMLNDAWVIRFCQAYGLTNNQPMEARQSLPGGAQMNWT